MVKDLQPILGVWNIIILSISNCDLKYPLERAYVVILGIAYFCWVQEDMFRSLGPSVFFP